MREKNCRTCWFFRPVGYLPAGTKPRRTEVETCGLENVPLKKFEACESWMSEAGTAPTVVQLSPEAEQANNKRMKREARKARREKTK